MPSVGRSEEARLGIGWRVRPAVDEGRETMSYRLQASDVQWRISHNPPQAFASTQEVLFPRHPASLRDSPPNPQPGYCALEALFLPHVCSGRTELAPALRRLPRDTGGG